MLNTYILIGLFILVIVALPIGLGLLLYFVPKKLGYPKTAKYLTIVYGLFILTVVFFNVFEDKLFSKNDAKELVEEQNIKLTDNFEVINNESSSAIGDYYHTFTLKISERDRKNAITTIKNANNFKVNNDSIEAFIYHRNTDKDFGKKVIHNYENTLNHIDKKVMHHHSDGYQ